MFLAANCHTGGKEKEHEPQHNKTNKMACAPSEDSDLPGHPNKLISLRCPSEEALGPWLSFQRTVKTLIRLGGCPGWSEPSLGAYAISLVLSWGDSHVLTSRMPYEKSAPCQMSYHATRATRHILPCSSRSYFVVVVVFLLLFLFFLFVCFFSLIRSIQAILVLSAWFV